MFQILANVLTSLNIFCGFYSMILAIKDEFMKSAWLVIICVVLDMLDGKIARLAKTSSDFGKEFDSLADIISFGIAPISLFYALTISLDVPLRIIILFLYLLAGAYRLARFNLYARQKQETHFLGLPITGSGGFFASFLLLLAKGKIILKPIVFLIIALVLAILMISKIKYPNFRNLKLWEALTISGIIIIAFLIWPHTTLCSVFSVYLVFGPLIYKYLLQNRV
ncbi:MAG: CDP-diacylglycerol--serine O-phosphatidyltransferase [Candidatus Omnitrophota bacterium]